MRLSLIAAMTPSGTIGRSGQLPWRLSADLQRFKALTMGHHLIMGRKTYDSLGRPLPGRTSIVITRQGSLPVPPGVLIAPSLEEAIDMAGGDEEPFVIGGAEIFQLALSRVNRLYVTWIEAEVFGGDTSFPDWRPGDWRLVSSEARAADAKNEYHTTFCIYDRI
jgi:dihydrofolate reductase